MRVLLLVLFVLSGCTVQAFDPRVDTLVREIQAGFQQRDEGMSKIATAVLDLQQKVTPKPETKEKK